MAKDGTPDKAAASAGTKAPFDTPRSGPRTLASLLPAITRPAFRKRAPASVAVMSDWAALAGPVVAAMATPRRFHGGTLTLAASGPAAMELQHGAGALMARLNAGLGRPMVERIRFVQATAAEVTPPQPTGSRDAPEPVAVSGVAGDGLRDALGRLGGRIAVRERGRDR
ncbi:MAG: DUF721 domain-containing protein [Gluconacetobacter diazotrophicus]|nr:DUF721 domain-containing protein [Gluconacetobacter diazotrophicus]